MHSSAEIQTRAEQYHWAILLFDQYIMILKMYHDRNSLLLTTTILIIISAMGMCIVIVKMATTRANRSHKTSGRTITIRRLYKLSMEASFQGRMASLSKRSTHSCAVSKLCKKTVEFKVSP